MSELSKYYRVPKINVTLPSRGKNYPEGFIDFSMDGSVPVRAMTAKDELLLKSPDALLNGDCIVSIIRSCVPEIKDPRKLLAPDVEALLLGVFYASYGPTIDIAATCPQETCNHDNKYQVVIRELLDTAEAFELPAVVETNIDESGDIKMRALVKPYSFESNTRNQLAMFEHSKLLQAVANDTNSDEEKLKTFNDCFTKMVELRFSNVVDCIDSLSVLERINGEWQEKSFTTREEIKDFVSNADSNLVDPIIEKVDELNKMGINNEFSATCEKCDHEWKTSIEFNPVNFFGSSSKHSKVKIS